jgi:hypothetical protein
MSAMRVAASIVIAIVFAPRAAIAQLPGSAQALYATACARCHADDGSGRVATPTVRTAPMDFTDCAVATPEPDADWELVIANGGPAAGLSSEMPAFGEALSPALITELVQHLRGFCTEPRWPIGNLNFPLALFTEKAFPENEFLVRPVVSDPDDGPVTVRLRTVYERRLGRRGHGEISIPVTSAVDEDGRSTGLGDISVSGKYVVHADNRGTRILTTGLEVAFPSGSESRNLGSGTTVFEPFLAAATLVVGTYVQGQVKLELPAGEPWSAKELVYNLYLGRDLQPTPSTWTFGVELNGVDEQLALTPQVRKPLTRTGALAAAFGVRIPIVHRADQTTQYAGYLLWEYLDPVRSRP